MAGLHHFFSVETALWIAPDTEISRCFMSEQSHVAHVVLTYERTRTEIIQTENIFR